LLKIVYSLLCIDIVIPTCL